MSQHASALIARRSLAAARRWYREPEIEARAIEATMMSGTAAAGNTRAKLKNTVPREAREERSKSIADVLRDPDELVVLFRLPAVVATAKHAAYRDPRNVGCRETPPLVNIGRRQCDYFAIGRLPCA